MQKQAFVLGRPLALLALIAFASCATPPAAGAPAAPAAGTAPAVSGTGASAAELEAESLAAKARSALDSNHLAEAIRFYISVIAIHGENPGAGTKAKADAAAAELQKIGQRLTIEPGSEWFDAKGGQVAGDARSLGKEGALFPSVYLYENFGAGKSPVADAPIYFEFVKNSGSIISLVTTDPYGKANTTIAKLDEPGKEALVRAYPLFRARGSSYVFKSVFRDFSYLPPANIARVIVLETSESGASDNPQTVDAVVTALKPLGLQFVAFNGKLADDAFKKAFGGDRAALGSFGADAKAPYVAFVLVEADKSRQMELNGKKYNIFTTQARATFRLVRADGTVVYALPLDGIKGQGGTPEAAALDGIKRAREALVPEIEKRLEAMKSSLYRE